MITSTLKIRVKISTLIALTLKLSLSMGLSYMTVIDAGSSGSRLHLYEYAANSPLTSLKEIYHAESEPGLSQYADSPQDAYQAIATLMQQSDNFLLEKNIKTPTPLYILATAGMRLLPETTQATIYTHLEHTLKKEHPEFDLRDIKTISGEMEGLFGWLDVNYLSGTFQNNTPSVASLDMGGASTEITYQINNLNNLNNLNKNPIIIRINNTRYTLISQSYLGLGQDQARLSALDNPASISCFPDHFDFFKCTQLYHDVIESKKIEPALTDLAQQKIIAHAGFYYTYHFFDSDTHLDKNTQQTAFVDTVNQRCQQDWESFQKAYPNTPTKYLHNYCANASYFYELLYHHYKINDEQLTVLNSINDQAIDWTLGAAIYYSALSDSDPLKN